MTDCATQVGDTSRMAFDPDLADASKPSTPPERLRELGRHRLIAVRMAVAANPSAPGDLVIQLSADASPKLREQVACNPSIDDKTMLVLAEDREPPVRRAAAINARGRDRVLETLSRSDDAVVRQIVAWHNSVVPLHHDLQTRLATDHDGEVRGHIAGSTQYRALFEQLMDDSNPRVRGACAANPRAMRSDIERLITDRSATVRSMAVALGVVYPDDEQLIRLARDRSVSTQWAVIMRVDAPREALEIVAEEGDDMNRSQASASLAGGSYSDQVAASDREKRASALLLGPFL